jgi:hypothetical protein
MSWEVIKDFYHRAYGIESKYVDLMASYDIIALCASGVGNSTISSVLHVDIDDVIKEIREYLHFDGYSDNLPVNPRKVLKDLEEIYCDKFDAFDKEVRRASIFSNSEVLRMWEVALKFRDIDSELSDNWV